MASRGAEVAREDSESVDGPSTSLRARIAAWHRTRETAEHGGTLWLALTIGIAFLTPFSHVNLQLTTSVFILATCLAVSLRWRVGWVVLVVIAAIGIWLRWTPFVGGYSDVLTV